MENEPTKNLRSRLFILLLIGVLMLGVFLLVPGTLRYWQGWSFIGLNLVANLIFCVYFYRRDPALLARRMLRKEKIGAQKIILFLMKAVSFLLYALCGLDHRFAWSKTYLAPVAWWLSALALLAYTGAYLLFIPVMNANRFAASVIQTESSQRVADQGPYRIVRHPMYSVIIVLWLLVPPALGSLVVWPAALLIVPILVWRLLNEEKMLRRDLPGYADYCQRTRYRLVPSVW